MGPVDIETVEVEAFTAVQIEAIGFALSEIRHQLRTETKDAIAKLNGEVAALRVEHRAEITKLNEEISRLRTEYTCKTGLLRFFRPKGR